MAKREIIFVLVLLLFIASSEQASFDYYQVVFQWQPATCNDITLPTRCVQNPDNRFSIHGVWPSKTSGSRVGPCNGTAFDPATIVSIRAGLNQNWPDVIRRKNQVFWSDEWRKHGTCSEDLLNQLQYFTFGLNIYHDEGKDIVEKLGKKKIIPNGKKYKKADVEKAISSVIGKRLGFRCNIDQSNYHQLHEISFCYAKDASTLQDCPSNATNCPTKFKWSSFKREHVEL
ncbi:ribonuclease MC-like [Momordica charantia]|uniref:Ribonuclease MC-like n=1 Tax=Momordica charantia TaxID=3673 RepID=A0A6J1DYI5_MOMCH|nr:ribonuclease MC-like [Momordica charantia]